ncbi:N-acetylmuramoyl-L-alanine amidase [bacterium]|nr:N-acetylmuramoyl-L-alanine amidase [bacterium]
MSKLDTINADLNKLRANFVIPEPVVIVNSFSEQADVPLVYSEADPQLLEFEGGSSDVSIKTQTYNLSTLKSKDKKIIAAVEKYNLANTSILGKGKKVDGLEFNDGQIVARGNTEQSNGLIQLKGTAGLEGEGIAQSPIKAIGTSIPIAVTSMQDQLSAEINADREAIGDFLDSLPPILGAPAGGFLSKAFKIIGAAGFAGNFVGTVGGGQPPNFLERQIDRVEQVVNNVVEFGEDVAGRIATAAGTVFEAIEATGVGQVFGNIVKKGKEFYAEFGKKLDDVIRAGGEALGPLGDAIEEGVEFLFPNLKNPADALDSEIFRDADGNVTAITIINRENNEAITLFVGDAGFQEGIAAIGTNGNLNVGQFMETVATQGADTLLNTGLNEITVRNPLNGLYNAVENTLGFNLSATGEFGTFLSGSTFSRLGGYELIDSGIASIKNFINNPLAQTNDFNRYFDLLRGGASGIVELTAGNSAVSASIQRGAFDWGALVANVSEAGSDSDPEAVKAAIRANGIANGATEEEIVEAQQQYDNALAIADNLRSPTIGGLLADDESVSAFDEEFELRIAKKFSYVSSLEELELEFATKLEGRGGQTLTGIKEGVSSIVIHATDTFSNKNIGAEEIDSIQRKLGAANNEIGYHYVIRRDGRLQRGRDLKKEGDHCSVGNYDQTSIGVVMVGGINSPSTEQIFQRSSSSFTRAQYDTLEMLIDTFYNHVPGGEIFGHNDLDPEELDPYFDVQEYVVSLFGKVNQTFSVAPETEITPPFIPDPTLVSIEDITTADFEGKFKPIYALQGTTNEHVNPDLLVAQIPRRLEIMCDKMGRRLIITSGFRTEAQGDAIGSSKSSLHRVGAAVDISRDGMSNSQLQNLIEIGISVGFKGIGVYNGHLHMDVGRRGAGKRCWGPNGSRTGLAGSQFAWARSVLNAYNYNTG